MDSDTKKTSSKEKTVEKKCFIVTPIGDVGSDVRKNTDGMINVILKPILKDSGYESHAAHELLDPGSISNQIIQKLMQDDLVIAVLTDLNPNVMYELAVRHAVGKPVISLAEEGTKIPFDITTDRVIFYENSISGVGNLKEILRQTIQKIDRGAEPDNPVYRAAKGAKIMKDVQVGDINNFILETLNLINSKLNTHIKNSVSNVKNTRNNSLTSVIVRKINGDLTRNEMVNYFDNFGFSPIQISSTLINGKSFFRVVFDNLSSEDLDKIYEILWEEEFEVVI